MKYMEFDLKVERIRRSENEASFTVIRSREDSLDRLQEEEGMDFTDEGDSVEDSVIHQDELSRLRGAIQRLDPEERDLIEALFFCGMTERDYGRKIGRPQTTVNYRKERILKKIKKLMEE